MDNVVEALQEPPSIKLGIKYEQRCFICGGGGLADDQRCGTCDGTGYASWSTWFWSFWRMAHKE